MRLFAALAVRLLSRLLIFKAALAASSFSMCARSSPLLGGGSRAGIATAGAGTGVRAGMAFAGVACTAVFPAFALAGAGGTAADAAEAGFALAGALRAVAFGSATAAVVFVDRATLVSHGHRRAMAS
jgi:hypothetical protein